MRGRVIDTQAKIMNGKPNLQQDGTMWKAKYSLRLVHFIISLLWWDNVTALPCLNSLDLPYQSLITAYPRVCTWRYLFTFLLNIFSFLSFNTISCSKVIFWSELASWMIVVWSFVYWLDLFFHFNQLNFTIGKRQSIHTYSAALAGISLLSWD